MALEMMIISLLQHVVDGVVLSFFLFPLWLPHFTSSLNTVTLCVCSLWPRVGKKRMKKRLSGLFGWIAHTQNSFISYCERREMWNANNLAFTTPPPPPSLDINVERPCHSR